MIKLTRSFFSNKTSCLFKAARSRCVTETLYFGCPLYEDEEDEDEKEDKKEDNKETDEEEEKE